MTENEILTGIVTGITNFGAFVELTDGRKGLVHISDITTVFVKDIADYLEQGQEVKVLILDASQDRLKLSIKKALEITGEELPKKEHAQKKRPVFEKQKSKPFDPSVPPPDFFEGKNASEKKSFDDIMSKYMKSAEERLSDAKKQAEHKRGGGYVRRG